MPGKLKKIFNLIGNMGWRYTAFRMRYEMLLRSGLLKKRFPAAPEYNQFMSLKVWKENEAQFFFQSRESLNFPKVQDSSLKENFTNIKAGKFLLFSSILIDLGPDYDWVTNPDSAFRYDVNKHWTEIADLSKEAGDIKFVWEKSRFSYLYDIIRYDYHFSEDCAAFVFKDILSWIKGNPVNCGPNYRCSQEMSLRVMNWTFALYYYRNSSALTDYVFNEIQYAVYWHIDHVYKNIEFSRIAVRNNHAVTETMALYFAGLFYPALPGAAEWKKKGRKWLEEEITYQVYEDGTYLQFSMNYHRIVVQLLTWAITLSEKNNEKFSDTFYDRAGKSLEFLRTCMVDENGWLPNYGANDGALFFNLSKAHYRDYRPQLQALGMTLGIDLGFNDHAEDVHWYGLDLHIKEKWQPENGIHEFNDGGYYIVREPQTLTFIKCGSYKDRPSHADNLHLDLWYKGANILPDAGSYKYNTDDETIRYFSGTASHNTVMLENKDQMLKGGRFIWYYWSQSEYAALKENEKEFIFIGEIKAFSYIKDGIIHKRTIVKMKGLPVWNVTDEVIGAPDNLFMNQVWHLPINGSEKALIEARNAVGDLLTPQLHEGWYSSLYGQKERTEEWHFGDRSNVIKTEIKISGNS